MNTVTTTNLYQFTEDVLLLLPFSLGTVVTNLTGSHTFEVVIVKPDGDTLNKTTGLIIPDSTKFEIAVPIDPLDLNRKGVYYYQVIRTTAGEAIRSTVSTFEVKASLPIGVVSAPATSPLENFFPFFGEQGEMQTSPLQYDPDTGTLLLDGVAVGSGGGGGGTPPSNTAYGSSWDGVTAVAPSKNVVYDKIEALDAQKANNSSLSSYQLLSGKNAANGYAGLDSSAKIDPAQLPALGISSIQTVANQTARLALSNVQEGDAVKEADTGITYMLSVLPASTNSNWIPISDITPDWSAIANKPILPTFIVNGDGSNVLSDDGTYVALGSGGGGGSSRFDDLEDDGVSGNMLIHNGTEYINQTPVELPQVGLNGYTVANTTTQRDLNGSTATISDLMNIVGTIINDMPSIGNVVPIGIAVSDETTDITTGTAKVTFRMPYSFHLTEVRATLNVASTSGVPTVNIKQNGTTILSTLITIDVNEKSSKTANTLPVISNNSLADDAEITVDVTVAGTGAKGLKIWLIGYKL